MNIIDNVIAYQPQFLPSTEVAKHCTYKHTSTSGGTYYGRTYGFEFTLEELNINRWGDGHAYKGQPFYRAIQKYGWNNFKHEVCITHLFNWECSFVECCGVFESKASGHSYNIAIPQVGGSPFSHEQSVIYGALGGQRCKELKIGIFGLTHDQRVEIGKYSADICRENQIGIFDEESRKVGYVRAENSRKERGSGFYSISHDERVVIGLRANDTNKKNGTSVCYDPKFRGLGVASQRENKQGFFNEDIQKRTHIIINERNKKEQKGFYGMSHDQHVNYGKLAYSKGLAHVPKETLRKNGSANLTKYNMSRKIFYVVDYNGSIFHGSVDTICTESGLPNNNEYFKYNKFPKKCGNVHVISFRTGTDYTDDEINTLLWQRELDI